MAMEFHQRWSFFLIFGFLFTSSLGTDLTDPEKYALNQCMTGINNDINTFISGEKEILCAVFTKTQMKIPKIDIKISSTDDTSQTDTEQDYLGCSQLPASTATVDQLINGIIQLQNNLASMTQTGSSVLQQTMTCAIKISPNNQEISGKINQKLMEIVQDVKKFGQDAIAALANSIQIPSTDRSALKACVSPVNVILESAFPPELINKLKCAAKALNIAFEFHITRVDKLFTVGTTSQTTLPTLDCSTSQFNTMGRPVILTTITGDLTTLASSLDGNQLHEAFKSAKTCVRSSSITSTAAANALISQYDQQVRNFKDFMKAVMQELHPGTNSNNGPLTNAEKSDLDNCMTGINTHLNTLMSGKKEILCAAFAKTQIKIPKIAIKLSSTDETSSPDTVQDYLGCSDLPASTATADQLINEIIQLQNNLATITQTDSPVLKQAMTCAITISPNNHEVSGKINQKLMEVVQNVTKYGQDAIAALAKGIQIPSTDRSALKACVTPVNAILESVFRSELINKLKCAARGLNIAFEFHITRVDKLFTLDTTSQTTLPTLDCSTFQFNTMGRPDILAAIIGDLTTMESSFDGNQFHDAFESAKTCVRSSSITSTAAANALISQYDQQIRNFKDFMKAVMQDLHSGTNSHNGPLTDAEKLALDNCMTGINTQFNTLMSGKKEILCAAFTKTQIKIPKTVIKFYSTDETSSPDTVQDYLGCSTLPASTATVDQLINGIIQLQNNLATMTQTGSSVLQQTMTCAIKIYPNNQEISGKINQKLMEIVQDVKKFGEDAIAALANSIQIPSTDRSALKACVSPVNVILESAFKPELINKLKCAARELHIAFEFRIPGVDKFFTSGTTSQTTTPTLDCSTFQFNSMGRADILTAIIGDLTTLAPSFDGNQFHDAFESAKTCLRSSSITSTAAANALISQYDQQVSKFKDFMKAVMQELNSGTNSHNGPLTDAEKLALDNCMTGINNQFNTLMSGKKEILCAAFTKTQIKIPKTVIKFYSTDETSSPDTVQDYLGCSNLPASTATVDQLINGIIQLQNNIATMTQTGSSVLQQTMTCAIKISPSNQEISGKINQKLMEIVQDVKKFGQDAIAALANSIQIPSTDRSALKACVSPVNAILESAFKPELINKLKCAARELHIAFEFRIPGVDKFFTVGTTSQTTLPTLDCSTFQFNSKGRADILTAIIGDLTTLAPSFDGNQFHDAFESAKTCVRSSSITSTAAANALISQYDQQVRKFKDFMKAVMQELNSGTNSHNGPLTDAEKLALDNCMTGINNQFNILMSGKKEILCAAFTKTQIKIPKTVIKFYSTDETSSPDTVQDYLGCSNLPASTATVDQLINGIIQLQNNLATMTQTGSSVLQQTMTCAIKISPNNQEISGKINQKLMEIVQDVKKFGQDAIAALANSIQIPSTDRSALKACVSPVNAIMESAFKPELINKLKCAARELHIAFEFRIPGVDKFFTVGTTSQTTLPTLDCSTFQFNSMGRADILTAIIGDLTTLAPSFDGNQFHDAFESAKTCVRSSSITSTAAASALISQYDQQVRKFKDFMKAVMQERNSGTNSNNGPLTDAEKLALDNCMTGFNNQLNTLMSGKKEILCAAFTKTQIKISKTDIKFSSTDKTSSPDTVQDYLGCSDLPASTATADQLINGIAQLENIFATMTQTDGSVLQQTMTCATAISPNNHEISVKIYQKLMNVVQDVTKFGQEAIGVLAKGLQISSTDRAALKVCVKTMNVILESDFTPEVVNKITCAARILQVPSELHLPNVDTFFPVDTASQTAPATTDCSSFHFDIMPRKEMIVDISGVLTTLMSSFENKIQQAHESMKTCVRSPSITNTAAANAVISQYDQQGRYFMDLFKAVSATPFFILAKPGMCPQPSKDSVGICLDECQNDLKCTKNKKCCYNGCAKVCVDPLKEGNQLTDSDRSIMKQCFATVDEKLKAKLVPQLVKKLRCAAKYSLGINPPQLDLPNIDTYTPSKTGTDANMSGGTIPSGKMPSGTGSDANSNTLDCSEFNFDGTAAADIVQAIANDMDMLKSFFESPEVSKALQATSVCYHKKLQNAAIGYAFQQEYQKSRSKFLELYYKFKAIPTISADSLSQIKSAEATMKQCWNDFNNNIFNPLNEYGRKIVCAIDYSAKIAMKLTDLGVELPEISPSVKDTTSSEKHQPQCGDLGYETMSDADIITSLNTMLDSVQQILDVDFPNALTTLEGCVPTLFNKFGAGSMISKSTLQKMSDMFKKEILHIKKALTPDACDDYPCMNGGICTVDQNGGFTCQCVKGYTGNNCDTKPVKPCSPSPCKNGAACRNLLNGGFQCRCLTGWQGPTCEQATSCVGILDCHGDCNGFAMTDISTGQCYGGNTGVKRDCYGVLGGTAVLNKCRHCVGGTTQLAQDYGVDACDGSCMFKKGYRSKVDCAGVCGGTAYYDRCAQKCIGGTTSYVKADFYDCGFCLRLSSGRKTRDCEGNCIGHAYINKCNHCVGGSTGKSKTYGMDACGVCGGDGSSCVDCNNVPNGKSILDACGVCGGNSDCVSLHPKLIPAQTEKTVQVVGSVLSATASQCVLIDANNAETTIELSPSTAADKITATIPGSLQAGSYKLSCKSQSDSQQADLAVLELYGTSAVQVTGVTPSQFTMEKRGKGIETFTITGSGFRPGITQCRFKTDDSTVVVVKAKVSESGTKAECTMKHPKKSGQLSLSLTFNDEDKIGQALEVTANYPQVEVSAQYSSNGRVIVVGFSEPVDLDCSSVFSSGLGSNIKCHYISPRTMIIENNDLPKDLTLSLREGIVKKAGEAFGQAATGTVVVKPPQRPIMPKAILYGPSRVGSCSDIKIRHGAKTIGNLGQPLTYTWTVSPDSTIEGQGTSRITIVNAQPGMLYRIVLKLCNAWQACVTGVKKVQKMSTAAPRVSIKTKVDTSSVGVSQKFMLVAKGELTPCARDTLKYKWSFDDSRVLVDNMTLNGRRLFIQPGDLPADTSIHATVDVWLESDPTIGTSDEIVITTVSSEPVPRVAGGQVKSIGLDSGTLLLDASESYDPDDVGDLSYQWICDYDQDFDKVCDRVFPAPKEGAVIILDPSTFDPNIVFTLKLIVQKTIGLSIKESAMSVVIETVPGVIPKVEVKIVGEKEKIKAEDMVVIQAKISSFSDVSIAWEMDTEEGFSTIDMTKTKQSEVVQSSTGEKHVWIKLNKGALSQGSAYRIFCKVTDKAGQTAVSAVEFSTMTGVLDCHLKAPTSYNVLSMIELGMKCVSDDHITYKYCVSPTATLETCVTLGYSESGSEAESDDDVFQIKMAPAKLGSDGNYFHVEACTEGGCFEITSSMVTVTENFGDSQQLVESATAQVQDAIKESNLQQAVLFIRTILQSVNPSGTSSRKRRSVGGDLTTTLLDVIKNALANTQMDQTAADDFLTSLEGLKREDLTSEQVGRVTDYFMQLAQYFFRESIKLPKKHVEHIEKWMSELVSTDSFYSQIDQFKDTLQNATRRHNVFGESVNYDFLSRHRDLVMFDQPADGLMTKQGDPVVNLGETLKTTYADGVGIHVKTFYPDQNPFSATSNDNILASNIVEVNIFDANTGDIIPVNNLNQPMSIVFNLLQTRTGMVPKCKYWKADTENWSDADVSTTKSENQVTCSSTHLTSFGVFLGPDVGTPCSANSCGEHGKCNVKSGLCNCTGLYGGASCEIDLNVPSALTIPDSDRIIFKDCVSSYDTLLTTKFQNDFNTKLLCAAKKLNLPLILDVTGVDKIFPVSSQTSSSLRAEPVCDAFGFATMTDSQIKQAIQEDVTSFAAKFDPTTSVAFNSAIQCLMQSTATNKKAAEELKTHYIAQYQLLEKFFKSIKGPDVGTPCSANSCGEHGKCNAKSGLCNCTGLYGGASCEIDLNVPSALTIPDSDRIIFKDCVSSYDTLLTTKFQNDFNTKLLCAAKKLNLPLILDVTGVDKIFPVSSQTSSSLRAEPVCDAFGFATMTDSQIKQAIQEDVTSFAAKFDPTTSVAFNSAIQCLMQSTATNKKAAEELKNHYIAQYQLLEKFFKSIKGPDVGTPCSANSCGEHGKCNAKSGLCNCTGLYGGASCEIDLNVPSALTIPDSDRIIFKDCVSSYDTLLTTKFQNDFNTKLLCAAKKLNLPLILDVTGVDKIFPVSSQTSSSLRAEPVCDAFGFATMTDSQIKQAIQEDVTSFAAKFDPTTSVAFNSAIQCLMQSTATNKKAAEELKNHYIAQYQLLEKFFKSIKGPDVGTPCSANSCGEHGKCNAKSGLCNCTGLYGGASCEIDLNVPSALTIPDSDRIIFKDCVSSYDTLLTTKFQNDFNTKLLCAAKKLNLPLILDVTGVDKIFPVSSQTSSSLRAEPVCDAFGFATMTDSQINQAIQEDVTSFAAKFDPTTSVAFNSAIQCLMQSTATNKKAAEELKNHYIAQYQLLEKFFKSIKGPDVGTPCSANSCGEHGKCNAKSGLCNCTGLYGGASCEIDLNVPSALTIPDSDRIIFKDCVSSYDTLLTTKFQNDFNTKLLCAAKKLNLPLILDVTGVDKIFPVSSQTSSSLRAEPVCDAFGFATMTDSQIKQAIQEDVTSFAAKFDPTTSVAFNSAIQCLMQSTATNKKAAEELKNHYIAQYQLLEKFFKSIKGPDVGTPCSANSCGEHGKCNAKSGLCNCTGLYGGASCEIDLNVPSALTIPDSDRIIFKDCVSSYDTLLSTKFQNDFNTKLLCAAKKLNLPLILDVTGVDKIFPVSSQTSSSLRAEPVCDAFGFATMTDSQIKQAIQEDVTSFAAKFDPTTSVAFNSAIQCLMQSTATNKKAAEELKNHYIAQYQLLEKFFKSIKGPDVGTPCSANSCGEHGKCNAKSGLCNCTGLYGGASCEIDLNVPSALTIPDSDRIIFKDCVSSYDTLLSTKFQNDFNTKLLCAAKKLNLPLILDVTGVDKIFPVSSQTSSSLRAEPVCDAFGFATMTDSQIKQAIQEDVTSFAAKFDPTTSVAFNSAIQCLMQSTATNKKAAEELKNHYIAQYQLLEKFFKSIKGPDVGTPCSANSCGEHGKCNAKSGLCNCTGLYGGASCEIDLNVPSALSIPDSDRIIFKDCVSSYDTLLTTKFQNDFNTKLLCAAKKLNLPLILDVTGVDKIFPVSSQTSSSLRAEPVCDAFGFATMTDSQIKQAIQEDVTSFAAKFDPTTSVAFNSAIQCLMQSTATNKKAAEELKNHYIAQYQLLEKFFKSIKGPDVGTPCSANSCGEHGKCNAKSGLCNCTGLYGGASCEIDLNVPSALTIPDSDRIIFKDCVSSYDTLLTTKFQNDFNTKLLCAAKKLNLPLILDVTGVDKIFPVSSQTSSSLRAEPVCDAFGFATMTDSQIKQAIQEDVTSFAAKFDPTTSVAFNSAIQCLMQSTATNKKAAEELKNHYIAQYQLLEKFFKSIKGPDVGTPCSANSCGEHGKCNAKSGLCNCTGLYGGASCEIDLNVPSALTIPDSDRIIFKDCVSSYDTLLTTKFQNDFNTKLLCAAKKLNLPLILDVTGVDKIFPVSSQTSSSLRAEPVCDAFGFATMTDSQIKQAIQEDVTSFAAKFDTTTSVAFNSAIQCLMQSTATNKKAAKELKNHYIAQYQLLEKFFKSIKGPDVGTPCSANSCGEHGKCNAKSGLCNCTGLYGGASCEIDLNVPSALTIPDSDRIIFKDCVSSYDTLLTTKFQNDFNTKLLCAAKKLNLPLILDVTGVDKIFPVSSQTSSSLRAEPVCDAFGFATMTDSQIKQAIQEDVTSFAAKFDPTTSVAFNSAIQCLMQSTATNKKAAEELKNHYIAQYQLLEKFFKSIKGPDVGTPCSANSCGEHGKCNAKSGLCNCTGLYGGASCEIDLNVPSALTIPDSDRIIFKDCVSSYDTLLTNKFQNDFNTKLLCAAKKLKLPLILDVTDVDKIFPVSSQTSSSLRAEPVCDAFGFATMTDSQIKQAIQEDVTSFAAKFDPATGVAFNSAIQCLMQSTATNKKAAEELKNHYLAQFEMLEKFFKSVKVVPAPCDNQPCLHSGTCTNSENGQTYTCMCPSQFKGDNCQIAWTPCDSNPCQNSGACTNSNDGQSFTCTCTNEFKGGNCQTARTPCDSNPCKNSGACTNSNDGQSFTCKCTNEFKGSNCETARTPCDSNPCQHSGACTNSNDGQSFTCTCTNEYLGDNCQTVNRCPAGKCGDNGNCVQATGMCQCQNDYTGMFCQNAPKIVVDLCESVNCGSNGECDSETGRCHCKNKFLGMLCDIVPDPCANKPCKNDGFCSRIMTSPGYKCLCTPEYTGGTCETAVVPAPCDSQPCLNSGTCTNSNNGQSFTCSCTDEYTGDNCQTEVTKQCASTPCKNGGVCFDVLKTNTYHCQCAKGWEGKNCDQSSGCQKQVDCNGVCGGSAVFHKKCRVCFGGNTDKTKSDVVGCDGECDRQAQLNKCGVCYGGKTGKTSTDGIDACGDCISRTSRSRVDCNGVCDGSAAFDKCSGTCVGGNTGKTAAEFYDCEGVCKGKMVSDACGKCVPPFTIGLTGSKFKDCNGKCWNSPGSFMAIINDCQQCVSDGSTGKDACGVCGGDGSSCQDCNGVINGPTKTDPCGVCGGDGSTCNSISGVKPNIIPSGVDKTLIVAGAGLATGTVCSINNKNLPTHRMLGAVDFTKITFSTGADLSPGTHTVSCVTPGQTPRTTELKVYGANAFSDLQISKSEIEINGGTESLTISGAKEDLIVGKTNCIVKDTESNIVVTVPATVSDNNLREAVCSVKHPKQPTQLQVALTLNDGEDLLKTFTLEAKTPPPTVTARFRDKVYSIKVSFSPGIGLLVKQCSDIFDATTVAALGPKAKCMSVSRTSVTISNIPTLTITSLSLKTGAAKKSGETRAVAATGNIDIDPSSNPLPPVAVISGPSVVSSCRDIYLSGLRSKGGLGKALTYKWTVTPNSGITLVGEATGKLKITGASAGQSLTVSLTVCNLFGTCAQASHKVQKSSSGIPDVKIRTQVDPDNVRVNKRVVLVADVQISSCANDFVDITWSFQGIEVDESQVNNRKYIIKPGQLQSNDEVVATVEVSLRNEPSKSNTAEITLHTTASKLKPKIKGGKERSVGVDYGNIIFDGSNSYDPDDLGAVITYEWSCQKITDQGEAGSCLTGSDVKTNALLEIPSSRLEPDSKYDFRLQISRDLGQTIKTASTLVTLKTIPGAPPKITMRDLTEDETLDINKPPVVGSEVEASQAVTVSWEVEEIDDYAFIDLSAAENVLKQSLNQIATNKYFSSLKLQPGVLEAGMSYMIWCKVLDSSGKLLSRSSTDFTMAPGVTGCEMVQPQPYTELDEIKVLVENCQSDSAMSYSLFTEKSDGELERLGSKQEMGEFELPNGPKAAKNTGNVFVVKVCPAFGGACQTVRSNPVVVTAMNTAALESKASDLYANLENDLKEDNPMKALFRCKVFLNWIMNELNTETGRKRRSVSLTSKVLTNKMIDLVDKSLSSEMDEDKGKDILDTLRPILPGDTSNDDIEKVVCQMSSVVKFNINNTVKMQNNDVENLQKWLMTAKSRNIDASKLCGLTEKLRIAQRIGLNFGESKDLNFADHQTRIMNSIPIDNIKSKDGTDGAVISFGEAVRNMFSGGSPVTIEMESYKPNENPYLTPAEMEKGRASPVIGITLADPTTGETVNSIKDLSEPIIIEMPITNPQPNMLLMCHYFDEASQTWTKEGQVTDLQTADTVICKSTHLTAFSVYSESDNSNTAEMVPIIGGCVAAAVLIAVIIVVVVVYKKHQRRSKVASSRSILVTPLGGSTEKLQQKNMY